MKKSCPKRNHFSSFEVSHEFPSLGMRVMLLNGGKLVQGDDEPGGVLLAIEDVTARKQIEEELVRSNEDLQRFAYVAAHDLRSPLNSGLRLLQLLARRTRNTLAEEDARTLDLALQSLQRLGDLMRDILAYSEVANAPHRRVSVLLQQPLKIALENLQHHIERSGAKIDIGDLPSVTADRTQIVMVFQNLIGNALKYRREARPHVKITALEQADHWRISVSDNGQGFSQDRATEIFQPFKRLHGSNFPGSGIGLATCKRAIERLGGQIWADSTPGQGSVFHFTLPMCADRPSSSPD